MFNKKLTKRVDELEKIVALLCKESIMKDMEKLSKHLSEVVENKKRGRPVKKK